MSRIKIEDLPILEDLSAKEIKGIFGGATLASSGTTADDQSMEVISPEDGSSEGEITLERGYTATDDLWKW